METQKKGDRAVTQAIASFTREGMVVSIPISESAQYDLVVDDGKKLSKVQVKYCGSKDGNVSLRRIHSNSKGYVVKTYDDNGFDLLYILRKDNLEFIYTRSELGTKHSIATNVANTFQVWKGRITGSVQHS